MTIVHIVMFKFNPTASDADAGGVLVSAAELKDKCLHPTTNAPYIKSFRAGRDNSPEGLQRGFTHVFVMEFETVEDRDYYVDTDPAHKEFKEAIGGLVKEAQVLDFTDRCYNH